MRFTKNKPAISLLAVMATVLYAAPVFAGAVINLTVTDMSGAPVFINQVNGVSLETQSSATLLTSNLAAPAPTFSARSAGMAAADMELPATSTSAQMALKMRITFDIVAAALESWTIDVSQTRRFALTLVDDPLSGFQSQAAIDLTSATYSVSPGPAGALAFPLGASEDTGAVFGNVDIPVNVSNNDNIVGTGSATITLDFAQRLIANSFATNTIAGGQEAAVRFGMLGSLTDVTADDYPGVGARDIDLDGHFVDVRVTFIPEPATMSLLSLAGLLLFRKRPQTYVK